MAAVATLLSASFGSPAGAQWLKAPVLVFQPGVVTANAISPTEIDANPGPGIRRETPDAASGLNIRFTMVVPTASPRFNLVLGTQFFPNGLDGSGDNSPIFYYGGIIPIAGVNAATRGWIDASLDPLGVYGPNPLYPNNSPYPYSHEFVLELALVGNVGKKMMGNMGFFSSLGVYLLFDQRLTHVPRDVDGDKDYFSPVILYGLTLPIAPWPGAQ